MISIVSLSAATVFFNYVLIFGHFGAPAMGTAGAGLGSTLAVLVGLLINVWFAIRFATANGFLKSLANPEEFTLMLAIAWPESVRQLMFSAGVVLIYVLIGWLGTAELAAFHVIISICMVAYMPHIGLGGAATTLVGEAHGRGDAYDAKRWGWQVSWVALIVFMVPAVVVVALPVIVLEWFGLAESTLLMAVMPLQIAVLAHVFDGSGKVLAAALVGVGATTVAMRLTLLPQWLFLLPALALVVCLDAGLLAAMSVFLIATLTTAVLFAVAWHRFDISTEHSFSA